MNETYIYDIGYILQKEFTNDNFDCDLFSKSVVVALTIHNLFGGEICSYIDGYYGNFYCNKINNHYYNFSENIGIFNYQNSHPVNINELLQNNKVAYIYHNFQIKLIKKYLEWLEKQNDAITDYLHLRHALVFFEKIRKKNLLHEQDANSSETQNPYDVTIEGLKKIIQNTERNYLNVQKYLFFQEKLATCEKEYCEFKEKILLKKR